jgi:regulator of ribonuclease activity A
VRDTDELNACAVGIRALGAVPRKSEKKGAGERNVQVTVAGVVVRPGDWIYADADGIVVAQEQLTA